MTPDPTPAELRQPSEDGPDFPDLRWLLIVMGCLMWFAALGCGGLGAYYLFVIPSLMGEYSDSIGSSMVGTGLSMFLASGALIVLGYGSVLVRKWAGNILYALGWSMGVVGAIACVAVIGIFAAAAGSMMSMSSSSAGGSPGALGMSEIGIIVFTIAIMIGIYLVPAAMLIVIYGMRNVRFTFRYYQKGPNWTDNIPTPILAWWTLIVWSAIYTVSNVPTTAQYLVLTGVLKSETISFLVSTVIALLTLGMIFLVLQLKPWAWWVMTSLTALGIVFTIYYFATFQPMEVAGLSDQEAMQVEQMNAIYTSNMAWIPAAVGGLIMGGFLYWIRRFYFADKSSASGDPLPA